MLGAKELDTKNTYVPDLTDIKESAERTYGEANAFFRKEELYLKDVERRLKSGILYLPEDIYDERHSIASDLAKCCEMYLKALFIFENNTPGNKINDLWDKLKKTEYETNSKGIKTRKTSHQIDRLISYLSADSRILLETRMLHVPMDLTDKYNEIGISDFLAKKGVIESTEKITFEQYFGWVEQHKKAYEMARYSGEQSSDVNIDFLFHLATQLKAVAQYKIKPWAHQKFNISEEELSKLPPEVKNLAASYPNIMSEGIVKLIANNEEVNKTISAMFESLTTLHQRQQYNELQAEYTPDLTNIKESAERTYGEANAFFRKEELYLQDVERRLKSEILYQPKDIYDERHSIASDLAKCCEMYLKALYIFENNVPGNKINDLWDKFKKTDYETDEKGNLIYQTSDGSITFMKYDQNGNQIVDTKGRPIYYDQNGKVYNENNRGAKIKRTRHQLDRLISYLSEDSKMLLETRMIHIPKSLTQKYNEVGMIDFLVKKGIIDFKEEITSEQYLSLIKQHKKVFEESRYSGEQSSDASVEFLYHLATQLRAVAQYKIKPWSRQIIDIPDKILRKLPPEIKELVIENPYIMTEAFIISIANNEDINETISSMYRH